MPNYQSMITDTYRERAAQPDSMLAYRRRYLPYTHKRRLYVGPYSRLTRSANTASRHLHQNRLINKYEM